MICKADSFTVDYLQPMLLIVWCSAINRQEMDALTNTLPNHDSIKRVSMLDGKLVEGDKLLILKRQTLEMTHFDFCVQFLRGHTLENQLSGIELYGYFP